MLFPWEWLKVGQGTAKYHIKKDGRNIFQLCTVSAFLKYSARKWYKTNFQVYTKKKWLETCSFTYQKNDPITLEITMAPMTLMESNVILRVANSMCECFSEGAIEKMCSGYVLKKQNWMLFIKIILVKMLKYCEAGRNQ